MGPRNALMSAAGEEIISRRRMIGRSIMCTRTAMFWDMDMAGDVVTVLCVPLIGGAGVLAGVRTTNSEMQNPDQISL